MNTDLKEADIIIVSTCSILFALGVLGFSLKQFTSVDSQLHTREKGIKENSEMVIKKNDYAQKNDTYYIVPAHTLR